MTEARVERKVLFLCCKNPVLIEYFTNLDLDDTVQTKAEYEKVHAEIIKTFNGIEINNDYVFYKAFSEIPDGKTPVPTYGFVKKIKKR